MQAALFDALKRPLSLAAKDGFKQLAEMNHLGYHFSGYCKVSKRKDLDKAGEQEGKDGKEDMTIEGDVWSDEPQCGGGEKQNQIGEHQAGENKGHLFDLGNAAVRGPSIWGGAYHPSGS